MITAGSEILKQTRKQLGLSQAEIGEHLHTDQRNISRIERGEKGLAPFEYFALMQMAGTPTEDLSPLFLQSKELKDFKMYKHLRRLLRDKCYSEIREILPEFEEGRASKQPFISQYIEFLKIAADEEIPHEQAIDRLYEVLAMSIKNFEKDNIAKYHFTYNEVSILIHIGMRLEFMDKKSCAIDLYKGLIENRGRILVSGEDKAKIFPALMFNVSTLLGKSERYEEALKYCQDAHAICKEHESYRLIPQILYNTACCYRFMGEEKHLYQTYFRRAYHVAHAFGNSKVLDILIKEAKDFGLSDL